jgi:3-oxoacyl-[acyl-carrier-protein] synthase II
MSAAVVITGLGVVSPLGLSAAELASRFSAGDCAIGPLTGMGVSDAIGATVGELPLDAIPADKRARIGRLDRLCRLFLSAASLAVDASGLSIEDAGAERVGLSFGTGLGCLLTNAEYNRKLVEHGPAAASPRLFAYTVSSAAAGEVSIALGIKGANVTLHAGMAAGLQAIGYGFDLIRMGKADVVLAGGADALGAPLVRGLADLRVLKPHAPVPFGGDVPGICPAEGAAVAVLERAERARDRGARVWARIDGYAAGFEPTLTQRHRASTGLAETMQRALALSGHASAEVGLVMTSAQGTALDGVELDAVRQLFPETHAPLLCAPKAAWGETFGADGALSLALATVLLSARPRLADRVLFDRAGVPLRAAVAQPRLQQAQLALVHALCYSGPTVTLVLAHEDWDAP